MTKKKKLALILDFETTGLLKPSVSPLSSQPRIIEIGAALVSRNGKVVEEMSELVNPGELITDTITQITGIRNEDLQGRPLLRSFLPKMRTLFERSEALVSHNLPFDSGVLRFELERNEAAKGWPWPRVQICTVQHYAAEFGGRNPKLTALYERKLGQKLSQSHRALDDVHKLLEVLLKDKFLMEVL